MKIIIRSILVGSFALAVVILPFSTASGQDTFSIVVVDTVTGDLGSAGASCIANSHIISDVIEGIGAIHTQAYWLSQNQQAARARMQEGLTPQEIIDWLIENDAQGNPSIRQYGIVAFIDSARSAAHTGVNTDDWKGHMIGPNYAIQGNILLGPGIIDSMEAAYLNTEGDLPDRLMAALEAAKVPGADTRCLPSGRSAISAFVRVVRIGDGMDEYLYEIVPNTPTGIDPIDSLRTLFDRWRIWQGLVGDLNEDGNLDIFDVIILINLVLDGGYDARGDMNLNGNLNIFDIILLINAVLSGGIDLALPDS